MSSKLSNMERRLSHGARHKTGNDIATCNRYLSRMAKLLTTTTTTTTSGFRGRLVLG